MSFFGSCSFDSGNICEYCVSAMFWYGIFTISFYMVLQGSRRSEILILEQESCKLAYIHLQFYDFTMICLILLTLWSQHFNVRMIKTNHQVNLVVRSLETNTWHFLLIILNRISVMQEMQSHKLSCWHKSLSNLLMVGLVRGFFPQKMQNKCTTWPLCFQCESPFFRKIPACLQVTSRNCF